MTKASDYYTALAHTGETHLGDGVYAYQEPGYIVLRVEGNTHNVYLEPAVAKALVEYIGTAREGGQ